MRLDSRRARLLTALAEEQGISRSDVLRLAIDQLGERRFGRPAAGGPPVVPGWQSAVAAAEAGQDGESEGFGSDAELLEAVDDALVRHRRLIEMLEPATAA